VKLRLIRCNCGDNSFYSGPGPSFLISSIVSISPLELSSWTPTLHSLHSYFNFKLRVYTFLLLFFDSLAGKAILATSIKLCLVDNQPSSGVAIAGVRVESLPVKIIMNFRRWGHVGSDMPSWGLAGYSYKLMWQSLWKHIAISFH